MADAAGVALGLALFAAPHLEPPLEGAVGLLGLKSELDRGAKSLSLSHVPRSHPQIVEGARTIFAAMPFAEGYEDVYFVAMREAAKVVNAACRRIDREQYVGDVTEKLRELLTSCDVIIADISDANPNVLYELGYAHALGVKAIHICRTPLDSMPFDVRNWNTIPYAQGRTHALRDALIDRLKAVLG